MKSKLINIVLIIFIVSIFVFKDFIYLLLDVHIFYPDLMVDRYISFNKDVTDELNDVKFDVISTRVLYRDIHNFKKEITIYKGENHDFKENMAVINENGLVGVITDVFDTTSKVMLLTNKDISISVGASNNYGLLNYEDDKIVITNLVNDNLELLDNVYTSGLANLYEGIYIGQIDKKDDSKVDNTYIINSSVNFDDLNYLYVIKDVK